MKRGAERKVGGNISRTDKIIGCNNPKNPGIVTFVNGKSRCGCEMATSQAEGYATITWVKLCNHHKKGTT